MHVSAMPSLLHCLCLLEVESVNLEESAVLHFLLSSRPRCAVGSGLAAEPAARSVGWTVGWTLQGRLSAAVKHDR
ncbi:hypothetical protein LI328DRAFT_129682 [Trichoderma asperelloides]|nr:hypothetical protein LI328DRAFT_129682 [Trichoderma asperelloides]